MEIAVIGLGSWGLSFLERIVTGSRSQWAPVSVHVVEPGTPGSGVYAVDQPDYLILNTPCGQISLYPWQDEGPSPAYAVGLFEWVTVAGYRWVGDTCRVGTGGRAIGPDDYIPRRLMGEYLQWFYATLVASAPPKVLITHHHTEAVNVVAQSSGHERVLLADGGQFDVDHVILTSGHTGNVEPPSDPALISRPYPVERYIDAIAHGDTVGVEGMGLVATDVVMALTVGRGGSFTEHGDRLRYVRSGSEPALRSFSRSGFPYTAKAVATVDESDEYQAANLHAPGGGARSRRSGHRPSEAPSRLSHRHPSPHPRRDAGQVLLAVGLPPNGRGAGEEVRKRLGGAWSDGTYGAVVRALSASYGEFDPSWHFFGPHVDYVSAKDYEAQIYSIVEADLVEALRGGTGPVKSAYEVLRHVRDLMRSVIEFKGLSLESYIDFRDNIKTRVNRLVAGPPALRSKQLLALIDAEVVTVPLGPLPVISPGLERGFVLSARSFEQPYSEPVDWLIHGHLENPTISRSSSSLLRQLWRERQAEPVELRRHRGRQRRVGPVLPSDRLSRAPGPEDLGLRLAHRGRALLHPLRPVAEEPAAGLPRRPAMCRGDFELRTSRRTPVRRRLHRSLVDDGDFLVEEPLDLEYLLVAVGNAGDLEDELARPLPPVDGLTGAFVDIDELDSRQARYEVEACDARHRTGGHRRLVEKRHPMREQGTGSPRTIRSPRAMRIESRMMDSPLA